MWSVIYAGCCAGFSPDLPALMSHGIQVTKRCSALIDRSVEACVAELDKVARWEGDEWLAFNAALVSHEGPHTRLYGVPLHNSTGHTEFMTQANTNSGEQNKAQRKNHFSWMKVPKINI